jgi:hypothetical protein
MINKTQSHGKLYVIAFTALLFLLPGMVKAQETVAYTGYLESAGAAFSGTARMKFAILDWTGAVTLWSNDDTHNGQPLNAVNVLVNDGQFSVVLGDVSQTNMTAIPASIFDGSDLFLRVWVDDGVNGFEQLAPDNGFVGVTHAAHATVANTVVDGGIGSTQIAPEAINATHIAIGAVPADRISRTNLDADTLDGIDSADFALKSDLGAGGSGGPLAAGSVGTKELADAAVTTAKIARGAVTSAQINRTGLDADTLDGINSADFALKSDLATGGGALAAGSVGTTELADAAVTNAKLASGAVSASKIDLSVSTTTIVVNSSSNSTGLRGGFTDLAITRSPRRFCALTRTNQNLGDPSINVTPLSVTVDPPLITMANAPVTFTPPTAEITKPGVTTTNVVGFTVVTGVSALSATINGGAVELTDPLFTLSRPKVNVDQPTVSINWPSFDCEVTQNNAGLWTVKGTITEAQGGTSLTCTMTCF